MSVYTYSALTCALILVACSVTSLGLTAYVQSWTNAHRTGGIAFNGNGYNGWTIYWLPPTVLSRGNQFALATSVVGIVYGLCIAFVLYKRQGFSMNITGRKTRTITWLSFATIFALFFAIMALASLLLIFIDSSVNNWALSLCKAAHRNTGTCSGAGYVHTTVERWSCKISSTYDRSSFVNQNSLEGFTDICKITKVTKYWTITVLVFAILTCFSILLEMRRRNIEKYAGEGAATGKTTHTSSLSSTSSGRGLDGGQHIAAPPYIPKSELSDSDKKTKQEMLGSPISEIDPGSAMTKGELSGNGAERKELDADVLHVNRTELPAQ